MLGSIKCEPNLATQPSKDFCTLELSVERFSFSVKGNNYHLYSASPRV
jgi:hypothetical protein